MSLATLRAECGHDYVGFAFRSGRVRARCADCVKRMARAIDQANQDRALQLASTVPTQRNFKPSKAKRLRIYERDGWICQLCHSPVDPSLHPSDDLAASLDHIICRSWTPRPDHSDANLRLAHRLCNALRGDEGHWLSRPMRPMRYPARPRAQGEGAKPQRPRTAGEVTRCPDP